MRPARIFRQASTDLWLGAALIGAGTYLVWSANRRGKQTPFAAKFLPGM